MLRALLNRGPFPGVMHPALWLALCLLAASPLAWVAQDQSEPELLVSIALRDGEHPILDVSLTNPGPSALDLWTDTLPGNSYYAVDLKAVTYDAARERLEQRLPIEDYPQIAHTRLNPQETISGTVDLVAHFPSLGEVRKHHKVKISWSYRGSLSGGGSTKQYSGALLLGERSGASESAAEQVEPPTWEQFAASIVKYPYHAPAERVAQIKSGLARVTRCMDQSAVRALLGVPDYGEAVFGPKGPRERPLGSSWTYYLSMREDSASENDTTVQIFFDMHGRATWIAPAHIEGAREVGAPGEKCTG